LKFQRFGQREAPARVRAWPEGTTKEKDFTFHLSGSEEEEDETILDAFYLLLGVVQPRGPAHIRGLVFPPPISICLGRGK
jgi:hypothetical protein